MTRTGHRLLGASCALALGQILHWPLAEVMIGAVLAAAAAPLPDVDQRGWWKPLRAYRPLQHRRLTHWWGWPAAGAVLSYALPPAVRWVAAALLIGWASHLLGDWVFGKRGPRSTGWRGAGIPLAPWWAYHGLGLDSGGRLERFLAWPLLGLVLTVQTALMIGAL